MTERLYDIVLQSPLGAKHGQLALNRADGRLWGSCTLLGSTTPCSGTISPQGRCTLRGSFQTFMSRIEFCGEGRADEQSVTLRLSDGSNQYELTGTARAAP